MAHIFKHPSKDQKGIVVFTHKEIKHYVKFKKATRFEWVNKMQEAVLPLTELQPWYQKHFDRIRENYFVGVHFGWRHEQFPTLPFVDFYMGGEGTVSFAEPEKAFRIPLNSRAFSPEIFHIREDVPKFYDIICVSRNAKFKNLNLLLQEIRKIYDLGKPYRVMLLVPTGRNESTNSHYTALEDDYYSLFSAEERERFVLLKLSQNLSVMGLPQSEVARLYQQSKVFTLFSNLEGESRVISEALLCGLPVVIKDDLQGGGKDLLTPKNSVEFSEYAEAHKALIEAVENVDRFEVSTEELIKATHEDHSIPVLKSYLSKLYAAHGQTFDGSLIHTDRLALRLPAHELSVPWMEGRFKTADVLEKPMFEIFMKNLR